MPYWVIYSRRQATGIGERRVPARIIAVARRRFLPAVLRDDLQAIGELLDGSDFWEPGELYVRPIEFKEKEKEWRQQRHNPQQS